MPDLDTLLGHASPGGGGKLFAILSTANANLTIPDGCILVVASVRSNTAIVTVTLPLIADTRPCAIFLSCPDGAANAVTIAPRGGNTVFGGASASIAADNLVTLISQPGTTDWQGQVAT